ncbi:MAG: aldo/keto reductase, partial [Phycisphaerae bacterium]|nr:aldo/keto reductase [Phycisphaerae bacterium]
MNYRKFGNVDFEVSALGFGCMRLPTRGKDEDIDEPLAVEMLRYAIDQGVNYLDTAYIYHGRNSESLVGKALANGYRDKVKVATKLPPPPGAPGAWSVEKTEDFDRLLNEQSAKLKTEHIDFYLLHNMNRTLWPKLRDLGVVAWVEKALADGRIGHVGFS